LPASIHSAEDGQRRTHFPFTLLLLRHWRAGLGALEREQIDRLGGF
jgi:hypothetical protein